ncbi:Aste57867_13524 [Aphanomyces stellatus]|uniref:Aste57867_13524 protein n=1 Tax=Aphanomyces stellatus TaxID=120398 RepID=A0A485KZ31_9STRA|nr:hypothetical protein As57867_013474 [Aphanomyces stellatus]VFT90362.1 Aste57867_13524 [Aphanomyces stellatus]
MMQATGHHHRLPPPEVVVQIVYYLDDSATVFAFLNVLGTSDSRGPLEPLWRLCLLHNHKSLWPSLCLTKDVVRDPVSRRHVEAVLQYCPAVEVLWVESLDWLLRYVGPATALAWKALIPRPSDWIGKWVQLPITTVDVTTKNQFLLGGVLVAASRGHFPRLEGVTVRPQVSLGHMLEVAARSGSKLIDLDLRCVDDEMMTTTMTRHAIHWLTTVPVRTFRFMPLPFDPSVDKALRAAFFSALFQCPMQVLVLANFKQCGYDWTVFPLGMAALVIDGNLLTPENLIQLADVLPLSPALKRLSLVDMHLGKDFEANDTTVLARLLEAQATSNITTLQLHAWAYLWNLDWARLEPYLQRTTLQNLSLTNNFGASKNYSRHIAHALQRNNSIRHVDLSHNRLCKADIMALLNCTLYRSVPLAMLCVSGCSKPFAEHDKRQLRTMARDQGIENFIIR